MRVCVCVGGGKASPLVTLGGRGASVPSSCGGPGWGEGQGATLGTLLSGPGNMQQTIHFLSDISSRTDPNPTLGVYDFDSPSDSLSSLLQDMTTQLPHFCLLIINLYVAVRSKLRQPIPQSLTTVMPCNRHPVSEGGDN